MPPQWNYVRHHSSAKIPRVPDRACGSPDQDCSLQGAVGIAAGARPWARCRNALGTRGKKLRLTRIPLPARPEAQQPGVGPRAGSPRFRFFAVLGTHPAFRLSTPKTADGNETARSERPRPGSKGPVIDPGYVLDDPMHAIRIHRTALGGVHGLSLGQLRFRFALGV